MLELGEVVEHHGLRSRPSSSDGSNGLLVRDRVPGRLDHLSEPVTARLNQIEQLVRIAVLTHHAGDMAGIPAVVLPLMMVLFHVPACDIEHVRAHQPESRHPVRRRLALRPELCCTG